MAGKADSQGLLLWGLKQAKRPPSADYPLGWGKAVFFWSFVVALVLFSLGGVFSLYEGWHKLHSLEPLSYPWVAVGILVFGLAAETVSLRACLKEVAKVRGGRGLWRWFRESRQSELVVILGEDLAALLGLALALAAILVAIFTGDPKWDALGSMAIGTVLIVVAAGIAIEIKGLLIGRSADPQTEARLREFLQQRGEAGGVSRDPVALLRAGYRRLAGNQGGPARRRGGEIGACPGFFSSTIWKKTSSLRTMPSS